MKDISDFKYDNARDLLRFIMNVSNTNVELTDDEKWKIWQDFNIWDSKIVGEESNNWTDEEVDFGIHHD